MNAQLMTSDQQKFTYLRYQNYSERRKNMSIGALMKTILRKKLLPVFFKKNPNFKSYLFQKDTIAIVVK